MDFPGEKLVIRLIETIEKSGTGIFRPWQIKRVARAEADAQRESAISNALTQREISKPEIYLEQATEFAKNIFPNTPADLIDFSIKSDLVEKIRKQENITQAISLAEETLAMDPEDPPQERVDMDWYFRWRENAGTVSSELLQQIWGNVLAGEIKKPGTHSLRTLDFLKNLSQAEARVIESIAPYIVNNVAIIFGTGIEMGSNLPSIEFKNLPTANDIIILEEIGLINRGSGLGFSFAKTHSKFSNDYFGRIFQCGARAIAATTLDKEKEIRLCFYKLTSLGKDIFQLVDGVANEFYLSEIAQFLANDGFDSELMDRILGPDGKFTSKNLVRIWPKP